MDKLLRLFPAVKGIIWIVIMATLAYAALKEKSESTARSLGTGRPLMEAIEIHDSAISELKRETAVHKEAIAYIREDLREVKLGVRELLRSNRRER